MRVKFFDIKNLRLSLKAVATGIITGIIWIIPMTGARYVITQFNMPLVGLGIALVSLLGYLYTWGFFARKIFNIRD